MENVETIVKNKTEEIERLRNINTKLNNLINRKNKIIKEFKSKIDYLDIILQSKDLVTTSIISSAYGMTENEFNILLKDLDIQYKDYDHWSLKSEFINRGYTKTEIYKLNNGKIIYEMNWTQKGRLFLYYILMENNILPLIEQK